MKSNEIKERISAIRKMAAYGPTPLEEGILTFLEDLTGVNDEQPAPVDPVSVPAEDEDVDED